VSELVVAVPASVVVDCASVVSVNVVDVPELVVSVIPEVVSATVVVTVVSVGPGVPDSVVAKVVCVSVVPVAAAEVPELVASVVVVPASVVKSDVLARAAALSRTITSSSHS